MSSCINYNDIKTSLNHNAFSLFLLFASHSATVPKKSTVIIGNKEANAIRPKASIRTDRPGILDASPIPNAVTNGTVTVDVVTPPES